ncbi:hypothetical protein DNU06_02510 [Putridiphycobacter roseus]|uniref:GIY-YIG domain-containing protein n=1 Tax=Putridiphycobacter roseus TaxID=2219161 RepID=A0A2W1N6F6_9FLAO|nr:GIY-YIG nuclease family protein [Putridiphycobacter roseus]PZE18721.1 hypothetical protein DNU06_02510 [Putridiphycobacter roseus]
MANCYIIHSESLNRFYTGITTDSVEERLIKHNDGSYGAHRFTSKASDWKIFLIIELTDYSHAVRLEKFIKSQKSAKYIQNLKKYPELVEKIVLRTK